MHIETAKTAGDLREIIMGWRMKAETVAFVPTMGALHAGHLSLVEMAKKLCDRVVVSIFVNPKQFGANEDFSKYPRTLNEDIALLATASADAVYIPEVDEIYPEDFQTVISVKGISEGLCGAARPGHFDGVATIVAKLCFLVLPDVLILGEKDFQQLKLVQQMLKDLAVPIQLIPAPTLREEDGLAMSSRNRYLSAEDRKKAAGLYKTLQETKSLILDNTPVDKALAYGKEQLIKLGFAKVDYLELREEDSLRPLAELTAPARLLVAAFLGTTRLIDNIEVRG